MSNFLTVGNEGNFLIVGFTVKEDTPGNRRKLQADLKKVSAQSISDSTVQARDIFKLNERVKRLEEQLQELKLKVAV